MKDVAIAAIAIACGVVILLFIWLVCFCKQNTLGPFRSRKDDEERQLLSRLHSNKGLRQKHKVLIKKCEQDNMGLRTVESEIIKRMHQLRENKTWTQELDDGQTPVLVFCVNASRIGTDIESALTGIRDNRPVVVVLHCKNSSSLRGDLSDDDYLLDQELRDRVTGIAHFAFSDLEGFFSCRQNDDGYRKLSELLNRVDIK